MLKSSWKFEISFSFWKNHTNSIRFHRKGGLVSTTGILAYLFKLSGRHFKICLAFLSSFSQIIRFHRKGSLVSTAVVQRLSCFTNGFSFSFFRKCSTSILNFDFLAQIFYFPFPVTQPQGRYKPDKISQKMRPSKPNGGLNIWFSGWNFWLFFFPNFSLSKIFELF